MPQTISFEGQQHVFPDDFTQADIAAALEIAPAAPSVAADVAKSGGIGLAKAGLGLAGIGADAREFNASMISKGAGAMGYDLPPASISSVMRFIPGMGGATSQQLQSTIEGTTGKFYEPQTTAGKYAETAGEFAPGILGPGRLLPKALSQVAAPALAGETAAQLTKGTAAEPYAKAGSAIAASLLTHRPPKSTGALTVEDLATASTRAYDDVHALGLEMKAQPVANLAHQIENNLTKDGLTARNAKPVYDAIETLKNPPVGAVVTSHNFDNLRKEMVQATKSADGSVRQAAGRTIGMLDDYLASLPSSHVVRGDAQLASDLFKEARGNWAAMKRLEAAGGKIELGELNAGTAHSGHNVDNALRQAIKQLIRPDKYGKTQAQKMGFNAEEIAQMRKIAMGTSAGNVVRTLGNMAGGGLGIGVPITAGIAAYHLGPEGAALPIAGFGLRKLGNAMTTRQAGKLEAMVGQRSPLGAMRGPPVMLPQLPPGVLAALLARPQSQQ